MLIAMFLSGVYLSYQFIIEWGFGPVDIGPLEGWEIWVTYMSMSPVVLLAAIACWFIFVLWAIGGWLEG
jgi:hypothetical protein